MKDVMLVALAVFANSETPMEHDVTLNVGGFLLSGTVIGYKNYVQHNETINAIETALTKLRETKPVTESDEDIDDSPNFIHLRDAQYFLPGNQPVPGSQGLFVRVPIESVCSFSFGRLKVSTVR